MPKTYTHTEIHSAVMAGRRYQPLLRTLGFGSQKLADGDKINFDSATDNLTIAPLVHREAVGQVLSSRGYETTSLTPAYTKPKMSVRYNELSVAPFGTDPKANISEKAKFAQVLTMKAQELDTKISRLQDYMAAKLLVDGKVDITSDSYGNYLLDFQRPAGNSAVPSTLWDATGASPIEDVEAHANKMDKPVASIVVGSLAWSLWRKDPKFNNTIDLNLNSMGHDIMELSGGQMPIDRSWRKVGYHAGLGVNIYLDNTKVEVGGTLELQVPANVVLFIPAPEYGVFGFGQIHDVGAGFKAMPIFWKNYITTDPAIPFIQAHCAPVPFHTNIQSTGKLTVT